MRVLHINCNYLGTTLHQNMVRGLTSKDIVNEVFVPISHNKTEFAISPDNNVNIVKCFNNIDRMSFFLKQKKIVNAIEQKIDVNKFDIIHAYTLFTDGNIARTLSKKYGKPYVVAVRNTDVNAFFKYRFYLRTRGVEILEDAERVFFLSKAYRNTVFKDYIPIEKQEIISEKTDIIPNGIDEYWLDNKYYNRDYKKIIERIESKQIKLVYAGRIDKNKNLLCVDKAISILKNAGWSISYSVVGKIEEKNIYDQLVSREYFHYHEPVKKDRLIEYYRDADIFIMPSKTETFGLVYAEAMTQGLPVIYSRGQGFDGQFQEGEVGFSVDSSNPQEVANIVSNICSNYKAISERCLEHSTCFSWDNIISKYVSLYSAISRKDIK